MEKKKLKLKEMATAGLTSGFLNGLFGSGGGIVAVMFMRKITKDEKKAHAAATLMILILSGVSLFFYGINGHVDWRNGWKFIPGGLVGAVLGTFFLKKIKPQKLRKIFSCILIISGGVMLFL